MSEQQHVTKAEHTLSGVVVSDKMLKTAVVLVVRQVKHPLYGKIRRLSTKLHVDDPNNQCKVGDTVTIQSCRPISKTKNWKLINIVEKAQ
ncbi:MAG: 30S ribosomal protein S17 [Gammaproteobacteria bacterium]